MIQAALRVGGMRVPCRQHRRLIAQVLRAPHSRQESAHWDVLPASDNGSLAAATAETYRDKWYPTFEELFLAQPELFTPIASSSMEASSSMVTLDGVRNTRSRGSRLTDPDGLPWSTDSTMLDGEVITEISEHLRDPNVGGAVDQDSLLLSPFLVKKRDGKARARDEEWFRNLYHTEEWKRLSRRTRPDFKELTRDNRYYAGITRYKNHFERLLLFEQEEAERIVTDRLSNWSLERLQTEGYCISGLAGFWLESKYFGLPVAAFVLAGEAGQSLPIHRFTVGTRVLLSQKDPLRETPPIQGAIIAVQTTGNRIDVCFRERPMGLIEPTWRMDAAVSDITHQRMLNAIHMLSEDPAEQARKSTMHRQYIMHGTRLRDVLLRRSPTMSISLESSNEPVGALEPALVLADNDGLHNARSVDEVPQEIDDMLAELRREDELTGKDVQRPQLASPLMKDERLRSWAQRYSQLDPEVLPDDPVLQLNPTQVRAIALMLASRVSLVQGPPGTGKTKTIIEAIRLLKRHFNVAHPLLVCTFTNLAVDNLVEGLVRAGLRPLRFGTARHTKLGTQASDYTVRARRDGHILGPQLDKLIADGEKLSKQMAILAVKRDQARIGVDRVRLDKMMKVKKAEKIQLNRMVFKLERLLMQEIIDDSDVVCTTCISAGSASLNVADFPIVFVDEASMSTEPATLIPLMRGSEHLALIGDHKQLPPVITSDKAEEAGLGRSLFERLTEEGDVPSIMLDVQYRMHPALSRFPAKEFYDHSLLDGTVSARGEVVPELKPPQSKYLARRTVDDEDTDEMHNIIFLDHRHPEARKDRSVLNVGEAQLCCDIVEDLLMQNPDLAGRDIGVIAPYAAQIALFEKLLYHDTARDRWADALGSRRALEIRDVEVKTVDGFEGREKDVIVFSTVRNNSQGQIGFLADRRRLNVGLTRAKRGLVVAGSVRTLVQSPRGAWVRFLEDLNARSLVRVVRRD